MLKGNQRKRSGSDVDKEKIKTSKASEAVHNDNAKAAPTLRQALNNVDLTAGLYDGLPSFIDERKLPAIKGSDFVIEYASALLREGQKNPEDIDTQAILSTKLKNKVLILDSAKIDKKSSKNGNAKEKLKNRTLSAKQLRSLQVHNIPKEEQRYDLYLALNTLWNQYMDDLLQIKPNSNVNMSLLQQKLCKADLHGAIITVIKSKCASYVGSSGIVLQETENTFNIITQSNKIKVIPKANSNFSLKINNLKCTIFGNQFRFRAFERSARKFKSKATIDL